MKKYYCFFEVQNDAKQAKLCKYTLFGLPCIICKRYIGLCSSDLVMQMCRRFYWITVVQDYLEGKFICSTNCEKIYRMIPQNPSKTKL